MQRAPGRRSELADFNARRLLGGYTALAVLAMALSLALTGELAVTHRAPWWSFELSAGLFVGVGVGGVLALLSVAAMRWLARRATWARELSEDLRPVAQDLTTTHIVLVACLSSFAEELVFRGLLVSWLGVVPAALVFGLAHQIPGRSRWVWVTLASIAGLGFGLTFVATGSLLAAFVAHALINGLNLAWLRGQTTEPARSAPGASVVRVVPTS